MFASHTRHCLLVPHLVEAAMLHQFNAVATIVEGIASRWMSNETDAGRSTITCKSKHLKLAVHLNYTSIFN